MKKYYVRCSKIIFIVTFMIAGCTSRENCDVQKTKEGMGESLVAVTSKLKNEKTKKIMSEAVEDFDLVVTGKAPRHAKLGASSLNGISNFQGEGYTLQVVDTEGTVSGGVVHIYGPILEFSDSDFEFLQKQLSNVKIYDHEKYLSFKGLK